MKYMLLIYENEAEWDALSEAQQRAEMGDRRILREEAARIVAQHRLFVVEN